MDTVGNASIRVDSVELLFSNYADNVPIDVVSTTGTMELAANQRNSGGKWVSLGVYDFLSGTSGYVQISNSNTNTGTHVAADAVKFVKAFEVNDVIMDNTDSTGVILTGAWTSSTGVSGYYGSNYIHDGGTGKGTKSIRYNPVLPYTGIYEVFARWTSSTGRSTNVPIDITATNGTFRVSVNQENNGGTWVSLGYYSFTSGTGASVLISNEGTTEGTYVIGDAVKFVLKK